MTRWNDAIEAPCEASRAEAGQRQQQLTKPPGSLGRLESLAVDFAGFQRKSCPRIDNVAVCIFAGDHGVVAEGVSAFPQAVTAQMIQNFASGGAAITVLSRELGASFGVVNLGTAERLPALEGVSDQQLARGTANFCEGPAMSEDLLARALDAGAAAVAPDAELFVGGEMGIGNTTAAAALGSALLGLPPAQTVGRGTGLDDSGLAVKREVVSRALALHAGDGRGPLELLRRLGGLEIAALAGAYLAAASRGIPSLVDGYICSVAALVACRLNPDLRPWLVFSHRSVEPGHNRVLAALDAEPLLDLELRLGEGSGAALAVPLVRSACALHSAMATFEQAGVSSSDGDRP